MEPMTIITSSFLLACMAEPDMTNMMDRSREEKVLTLHKGNGPTGGYYIDLHLDPDTQDWTLVYGFANGTSCVFAGDTGYEVHDVEPRGEAG